MSDFHFLRPAGFLALIPLAIALVWAWRGAAGASPWRRLLDPALQPLLLSGGMTAARPPKALALLALGWLLAVLALAGPAWERQPRPAFAPRDALVILFDLSRSMLARDLAPSRLERARYKVRALLRRRHGGLTGLVAFAGDAFAVTPLTDDTHTLTAHLGALSPELMPVQGSRLDRALSRGLEMLRRGKATRGALLLVTDGRPDSKALKAARELAAADFRLGILGVGTPDGALIPGRDGRPLRDAQGQLVRARLDPKALERLAIAGDGLYAGLAADDRDLDRLAPLWRFVPSAGKGERPRQAEDWIDRGPWLLPLLLPLATLGFRRGWLLGLTALPLLLPPAPAQAFAWRDLWQTPEQQAQTALERGRAEQAAALAQTPLRRGAALYRAGRFAAAAKTLEEAPGADGAYDRGNALARLGRYREAIAAYDRALKMQPGMADARKNKALLEALLRQRRQQQRPPPQGRPGQGGNPRRQPRPNAAGRQGQSQTQNASNGQGGPQAQNGNGQQGQPKAQKAGGRRGRPRPEKGQGGAQGAKRQARGKGASAQAGRRLEEDKGEGRRQETGTANAEQGSKDRASAQARPRGRAAGEAGGNAFAKALKEGSEGDRNDHPGAARPPARGRPKTGDPRQAAPLTSEERQAARQWLRRIPDDPGGLLRRKFLYQYRARGPHEAPAQPW